MEIKIKGGRILSFGFQWPPQFGYYKMFFDGNHRVLHLGVFYIGYYD